MASLAYCIEKFGGSLSAYDIERIKNYAAAQGKGIVGTTKGNQEAVNAYIKDLDVEYNDIVQQIEKQLAVETRSSKVSKEAAPLPRTGAIEGEGIPKPAIVKAYRGEFKPAGTQISTDYGYWGKGKYYSLEKKVAQRYAKGPDVQEVSIDTSNFAKMSVSEANSIKFEIAKNNPNFTTEEVAEQFGINLKKEGYDGFILEGKDREIVVYPKKAKPIPEPTPKVKKEKVEVTPEKKEPWQMGEHEYVQSSLEDLKGKIKLTGQARNLYLMEWKDKFTVTHQRSVEKAIQEGKLPKPKKEKIEVETTPEGKEYFITTREGTTKKVKGRPVSIKGFEKYEFFYSRDEDKFVVSEATTGFRIAAETTLKGAKVTAEINLDANKAEFDEKIKEARKFKKAGKPLGKPTGEKKFATKAIKPQETITRKDLREIFSRMKHIRTGKDKDGNLWFKATGRPKVTIYEVDHITGYLNTSSGQIPVGSYLKDIIELKTGGKGHTADSSTAYHEMHHWLEKNQILSTNDITALNRTIAKLKDISVSDITEEHRAYYVGDNISAWGTQKHPRIKRILRKLKDFMRAIYDFAAQTGWVEERERTAEHVLSDIESGRILKEKKEALAGVNQFAQTVSFSLKKAAKAVPDNPNFVKWFGDSKVSNKKGEPSPVYHVTTYGDFSIFEKSEQRAGVAGFGFYFTDQAGSNIYASHSQKFKLDKSWKGEEKKVNVMPVYLSIQKPLLVDDVQTLLNTYQGNGVFGTSREVSGWTENQKNLIQVDGYDGVIGAEYVREKKDGSFDIVGKHDKDAIAHPVYVVFEPTQIKSIYNTGKFSSTEPDIRYQMAGKKAVGAPTGQLAKAQFDKIKDIPIEDGQIIIRFSDDIEADLKRGWSGFMGERSDDIPENAVMQDFGQSLRFEKINNNLYYFFGEEAQKLGEVRKDIDTKEWVHVDHDGVAGFDLDLDEHGHTLKEVFSQLEKTSYATWDFSRSTESGKIFKEDKPFVLYSGNIGENKNINIILSGASEKTVNKFKAGVESAEGKQFATKPTPGYKELLKRYQEKQKTTDKTLKNIPPAKPPKEPSLYEKGKDNWFGNKDWAEVRNEIEKQKLQTLIKDAVGKTKNIFGKKIFGRRCKEVDQAIHIYLDLKRNPEHREKFYDELPKEYKRVVDRLDQIESDPKLKTIADHIRKEGDKIGQEALAADVIRNTIENHVNRVWKKRAGISERVFTDELQKFKIKSRHAKHRVFETILEGLAVKNENGKHVFDLQIKGATKNLQVLKDEIARVIEDKKLITEMRKMKTENGDPLLSTYRVNDTDVKIEHPNFKVWEFAASVDLIEKEIDDATGLSIGDSIRAKDRGNIGKIVAITDKSVDVRFVNKKEGTEKTVSFKKATVGKLERPLIKVKPSGRNFFITAEGTVLEKRELYAPEKIARDLNKILGVSRLKGVRALGAPVIDTLTKYNAIFKSWILVTSFFHHQAFLRSYYLPSQHKTRAEWNPFQAYKMGKKAIENMTPEIELLVRNGLTMFKMQDWEESVLRREDTVFGKILDKNTTSKAIKDKINALRERQANFLFGNFGAALKTQAALIELRNMTRKHPDMDVQERAKMVARLINDDFGGLHLGRMGRDPTIQHIMRLGLLAPDWSESNVRTMVKALRSPGGPEETAMYRRFWTSALTKGISAIFVANLLMSAFDDDDFEERYKKAWRAGHFRWLDIDITPVYKMLGGESEAKKYFSLFGHFRDPLKFIRHPIRSLHHKGSVIYGTFHEAMAGTDWKGQRFVTLSELIGVDDKGVYLTTTKTHKKGDPKGGKLAGKLVTYGAKGPISLEQMPSYMVSQLIGVQPIQVQNLIAMLTGEVAAFDGIARSLGMHTGTTYPATKSIRNDFVDEYARLRSAGKPISDLQKKVREYNLKRDKKNKIPWKNITEAGRKKIKLERELRRKALSKRR